MFSSFLINAQTFTTIAHGDYDDDNIWAGGVTPPENVSSGGVNFPIVPAAPLPVDLVALGANLTENNFVELLWITASEINNDYL